MDWLFAVCSGLYTVLIFYFGYRAGVDAGIERGPTQQMNNSCEFMRRQRAMDDITDIEQRLRTGASAREVETWHKAQD